MLRALKLDANSIVVEKAALVAAFFLFVWIRLGGVGFAHEFGDPVDVVKSREDSKRGDDDVDGRQINAVPLRI